MVGAITVTEPTSGVPVWARKRRKPGNPLVGLVLVPLALLGALTAGLAVREKSFTAAGVKMDAWVALGKARVEEVLDKSEGKPAAKTPSPPSAKTTNRRVRALWPVAESPPPR
jgi:hypothetical protein